MIRCAMATHSSQMYTLGPATSFATCASLRRQKEHAKACFLNITPPALDNRKCYLTTT
jgi:hypothetical protein